MTRNRPGFKRADLEIIPSGHTAARSLMEFMNVGGRNAGPTKVTTVPKLAPSSIAPAVSRRAWITLAILMSFYFIYNLDKLVLALLGDLVAHSLSLSDFDLGVLQGFVYSIPYGIGVMIMGAAVDRYSRGLLLFGGVFAWSLCAVASGLATGFSSLAVYRGGVGFCEAVLLPAAMALISASFPRERLAFAVGTFTAGGALGGIVGPIVGGPMIDHFLRIGGVGFPFLGHLEAWQATFIIVGLPGLVLAFLALSIPSGDRGAAHSRIGSNSSAEPLALRGYLADNWVFLALYMPAVSFVVSGCYTLLSWTPVYYGRAFGWDHSRIGFTYAAVLAIGAIGGVLWGRLGDFLSRTGMVDGIIRMYIVLLLIAIPAGALGFLVHNPWLSMPAIVIVSITLYGNSPSLAALQLAVPQHLRGRLTGIQLLIHSFIGLGAGPASAGFIADVLLGGRAAIGKAIFISVAGASSIAIILLLLARRHYIRAVQYSIGK